MAKTNPVIILPFDGFSSPEAIYARAQKFFASKFAAQLVYAVKLNDALHFPNVGPAILKRLRMDLPESVKFFTDLKIADVSETNKNTLRHYAEYNPVIVTVTSTVSLKGLLAVREALPNTKIAMVDTLTDVSDDECWRRYRKHPGYKIGEALDFFELMLGKDNPLQMAVCSPKEVKELKENFPQYEFITPGIRSPHMTKDHQERTTSAYDALLLGASYLVMGAQLTKGNPDKNISAEESQQITLEEIEKYFSEQ